MAKNRHNTPRDIIARIQCDTVIHWIIEPYDESKNVKEYVQQYEARVKKEKGGRLAEVLQLKVSRLDGDGQPATNRRGSLEYDVIYNKLG